MRWMMPECGILDEQLLGEGVPFETVLRRAMASAILDAEEEASAISTRPTIAAIVGEPWR